MTNNDHKTKIIYFHLHYQYPSEILYRLIVNEIMLRYRFKIQPVNPFNSDHDKTCQEKHENFV